MSDRFAFFVTSLAVILWAIAVICGVCMFSHERMFSDKYLCEELAEMDTSHNYHWSLRTGCRVEVDSGLWIDVDNTQYNEIDSSFN